MAYAGKDFDPTDATFESEQFGFNFARSRGDASDVIVGVVWTLVPVAGIDASASSRMSLPTFSGQIANVILTGLLGPVRYRLHAVATFSSTAVLSLYSFIPSQLLKN